MKTTSDFVGSIVLILHPVMRDTYVIAYVRKETLHKVTVSYWKSSRKDWSEETNIRNKDHIVKIMKYLSVNDSDLLDRAAQQLQFMCNLYFEKEREHRKTHLRKIEEFEVKVKR